MFVCTKVAVRINGGGGIMPSIFLDVDMVGVSRVGYHVRGSLYNVG